MWDNRGMFKRLSALWPGIPFFGWLALVWTMLAHASTAQFSLQLAASISTWLGKNAWVGFLLGFALLALAVGWPDIADKIPEEFPFPRTPGMRLNSVERQHLSLVQKQVDVDKRLDSVQSEITKRFGLAEMKIAVNAHKLETVDEAISNIRRDLGRINGDNKRIVDLLPSYFKHQDFVTTLKGSLRSAIDEYLSLREMYGMIPCVARPFSAWRPIKGAAGTADVATQAGEKLAQYLECYTETANFYASTWKCNPFDNSLFQHVSRWKDENDDSVSSERFLVMLRQHYSELQGIEANYAAVWSKDVRGSAAIS
jgi:hypothetical protein